MSSRTRKKLLLICRRAPYAGLLARAGLDLALAAAVFEQQLSVLFMDEGVWQLLPDQHSSDIGCKSIAKTLDSMPLYDLDKFYVEKQSLSSRGLDPQQLGGTTVILGALELPVFVDGFDQVWSF